MALSNVNNANKAQIVKLALGKKAGETAKANLPEYMKMTGSIFNAPNSDAKVSDQRAHILALNAQKSLKDLKPAARSSGKSKPLSEENLKSIDSVSEGKAAISAGRALTKTVKAGTKETQKDAKTANKLSSDAKNLDAQIKSDDKSFKAKLKSDQNEFKRENARIVKLVKQTEETQKEVDDAQHELDGLLATNSFSMGKEGSGGGNQQRVQELQMLIGSKVGLMQANGKMIYSLQRSQTRTLKRMNKTNNAYIKAQNVNKNNIQAQQNQTSGIIKTAQKIEELSSYAIAGGQALQVVGELLVLAGTSGTIITVGTSQALAAIGQGMIRVGKIAELVGNYGSTAANITKMAGYMSEGNLMGAMQSCAMAAQTGAAAVKGTKNLKSDFKAIDNQANAAKQSIEAKAQAKEIVKKQKADLPNGMTEKEARKYVAADLRAKMAAEYEKNPDSLTKIKDIRTFVDDESSTSLKSGIDKYKELSSAENLEKSFGIKTSNDVHYTEKTNQKGTTKTKIISNSKVDRKVSRSFKNEISKLNEKVSKYSTDWGAQIEKLGGSMTNVAAVFLQNKAMNEMYSPRPIPQYQMDARTRRIIERNQRFRAGRSYAY